MAIESGIINNTGPSVVLSETSFTILSSSGTDTSQVAWVLFTLI